MSIEIQGLESVQKRLSILADRLTGVQMKSTMNTIGNIIKNTIEDSFESESSPFGKKWAPLSIATKKRKKGTLILTESALLRHSFTIDATPKSVTVGTVKKYARIHQYGGKAGRGKKATIPARPFMPIDEGDNIEPKTLNAIIEYLDDKIGEAIK